MALVKKDKKDVICPQGKTFQLSVYAKDPVTNKITDLTGYEARVEVRSVLPTPDNEPSDEDVLVRLTSGDGDITFTPESGKVVITIDADITATFPVGTYYWELELERTSDGFVPYIMAPSKFKVLNEVTL